MCLQLPNGRVTIGQRSLSSNCSAPHFALAARARRHRPLVAAALPPAEYNTQRDPLAEPMLCAGALSVFALTAIDVLGTPSLHLSAALDTAAQGFVASHWPASAEARAVANAVSNVPIAAAVGTAAIAGITSGVRAPLRTARRAALLASCYFAPGDYWLAW